MQVRVGDGGNSALSEVVVIEAKDPRVCAEPQFVRAPAPGQVVIDEEPRCATALHPGVVEASEGREGIRAGALQYDRESGECLLKIVWTEQAFVPGEGGIEVVHQVL